MTARNNESLGARDMEVFLITEGDEHLLCSVDGIREGRDEEYAASILLGAVKAAVGAWLVDSGQEFSQDFKIVIR